MKLIVVTAPTFFVEEDKIITALFEEGLDILHLRKPETPGGVSFSVSEMSLQIF